MKFDSILLEVLVNGFVLFFLFSSFVNIDLLKMPQIVVLSTIIMNGYLINKKVLRGKKCKINLKQILAGVGIGIFNFIFLFMLKKIF